jgi:hypothetical protein
LSLKYQWSTAFEELNSSTDGPLKLISIKSFKVCAVIDDLKSFLTIFILLNPRSQATVDARITETVDINFANRGNLSRLARTLFKSSLNFLPLPKTLNSYHSLKMVHFMFSSQSSYWAMQVALENVVSMISFPLPQNVEVPFPLAR